MPRYRTVITSSWSVEDSFGYLSDFSSAAEWDPGVQSARRVDEGEVGVGSAFDLTVRVAGRPTVLRYVVTEIEPGRRVTFLASTRRMVSRDTLSFEPRGAGSSVTYDAHLSLTGWAALATPLLTVAFRRIGDRARDSLARVLQGPRGD